MDISTVRDDKDVLKTVDGADGETTGKVRGGPFTLVNGEGAASGRR